MHIELKPFLSCFGTFFHDLLHHSAKELTVWLGIKWAKFSGRRTENQNCLANTHEVRRCWTVSSAWSEKGHRTGWGRPLFCSLSAVQQRFLIASHINVLHLLGAQDFHLGPLLNCQGQWPSSKEILELSSTCLPLGPPNLNCQGQWPSKEILELSSTCHTR